MTASMPSRASRYDRLAALYGDERFLRDDKTRRVRAFLEAVHWWSWERDDLGIPKRERGGVPNEYLVARVPSLRTWRDAFRDDAPRYMPPPSIGCEHVLQSGPRAGQPCGRSAALSHRLTDPDTGEWRLAEWCAKHHELGRVAAWHEAHREGREGDPEPLPNYGGLIPCYLKSVRKISWEDMYRRLVPSWEPPKVGVCADDWAVLGRVHAPTRRPKLTLIIGGDEYPEPDS